MYVVYALWCPRRLDGILLICSSLCLRCVSSACSTRFLRCGPSWSSSPREGELSRCRTSKLREREGLTFEFEDLTRALASLRTLPMAAETLRSPDREFRQTNPFAAVLTRSHPAAGVNSSAFVTGSVRVRPYHDGSSDFVCVYRVQCTLYMTHLHSDTDQRLSGGGPSPNSVVSRAK